MNERNLVICDREIRYAKGLGENISGREDLKVKVYVCSSLTKAIELSKERNIHLFVVDESYSYEERKSVPASQIFVLARERVCDLGIEEHEVRKYQNAKHIIREIFEAYIDKTKENVMRNIRKECARIVAVYSPIHRVGKTAFAIAFGKECAKKKQVLYLNFEEFSGLTESEGLNMGDLLYYIKQGNGNLGIRLQAAIRKREHLDYIAPIPVARDMKEVSETEWKELIHEILQNSTYELIILDLSESMQGLWNMLELCDKVYMPILEDDISRRKIEQYDNNMKQMNKDVLLHNTYRFVMPQNVEEYARIRAKEEV